MPLKWRVPVVRQISLWTFVAYPLVHYRDFVYPRRALVLLLWTSVHCRYSAIWYRAIHTFL